MEAGDAYWILQIYGTTKRINKHYVFVLIESKQQKGTFENCSRRPVRHQPTGHNIIFKNINFYKTTPNILTHNTMSSKLTNKRKTLPICGEYI